MHGNPGLWDDGQLRCFVLCSGPFPVTGLPLGNIIWLVKLKALDILGRSCAALQTSTSWGVKGVRQTPTRRNYTANSNNFLKISFFCFFDIVSFDITISLIIAIVSLVNSLAN
jgi:hypothetical protein